MLGCNDIVVVGSISEELLNLYVDVLLKVRDSTYEVHIFDFGVTIFNCYTDVG